MLQPLLPTIFETEDGEEILNEVLKSIKKNVPVRVFCNTILVTDQFLESLVKPFHDGIIQKKVEEVGLIIVIVYFILYFAEL